MENIQLFGLFVVAIMVLSTAGYAMYSSAPQDVKKTGPTIPSVVDRPLTQSEKILILRSGKTLIQYQYPEGCMECLDDKIMLEIFTRQLDGFVVLEEFIGNDTQARMIAGATGDIIEIENITEVALFETFCKLPGTVKPKECLLMEI